MRQRRKSVPEEALQGLPIHARIRALREAAGLAGYEFAKLARISPSYLSLIESGEKIPSEDVAVKIANALNDDPELYRGWAHAGGREDRRRISSLETYLNYLSNGTAEAESELAFEEVETMSLDAMPTAEFRMEKPRTRVMLGDRRRAGQKFASPVVADSRVRGSAPPAAPSVVEIPVLAEGTDPGIDPAESEGVIGEIHLDRRMLPVENVERPFAYRPSDDALARVGKLIRPGELVVLTSTVGNLGPQSIHAVRFGGGIVLSRVLFKGNALLLLPPTGSSDFDIVEVEAREELARIIAGTVVLTVKSWGMGEKPRRDQDESRERALMPDGVRVGASAPRRSFNLLSRALSSLRREPSGGIRPYGSRGARVEGDRLVRDCDWKDKYGWRPVQRPDELDHIERHPEMKMRFNLIRDGEVRFVLEMNAGEWKTALGSYGDSPGWLKNGSITAITKMRDGVYTEEFKERWEPYVRRSLGSS